MINLIPKEEIENVHRAEKRRLLVIFEVLLLFSFVAFFLSLLSVDIYIKGEVSAKEMVTQEKKAASEKAGLSDLLKRMEADNVKMVELNSFFRKNLYLSDVLSELTENIPPGIYLKEIFFRETKAKGKNERDKRTVLVSGFARNRLVLFEFKKNLEKEANFLNLAFPPSNWINSQNIDFQFSFEIKQ